MGDGGAKDNAVQYVEIPVVNMDRAVRFYTSVFGWQVQVIPDMDYAMWQAEGGVGGGFDRNAKPAGGLGAKPYITVADIEATLVQIESAGGKTVRPRTPFADWGWLAHFEDTEGNVLGLWTGDGGG